jgi:hypothetical protein
MTPTGTLHDLGQKPLARQHHPRAAEQRHAAALHRTGFWPPSFAKAGIDVDALAGRLQEEGAASFVNSWNELMSCIEFKSSKIRKAN